MRILTSLAATVAVASVLSLIGFLACGSSTPAPKSASDTAGASDGGAADGASDGGGSSVCTGSDLDLVNVLVQSACEVPNAPSDAKLQDVSALLAVTVSASPNTVAPGGHADVVVTYTNKSQAPLSLSFLLDPTARFSVEVYTMKNARADLPHNKPPHGKSEGPPPEASAPGTARVTIAPGGKASAKVDWSAVRLKWAPELVKGTPPEQGYPTAPAGPLGRGMYTLKVITPLIGVFEGSEHEVSTAKTTLKVQ